MSGSPRNPFRRPVLELPRLSQRLGPHREDVPLDPAEVRAAIWHGAGNLQKAAQIMQCRPARIAALLRVNTQLAEERQAAAELQVDQAEAVILEALTDEDDKLRRDDAARFVLTHAGRKRGWSKDGVTQPMTFGSGTGGVSVSAGGTSGAVSIRWETELPPAPAPIMIDVTPKE